MIYNEEIAKEYGRSNLNMGGIAATEYKPNPTKDDYSSGFIARYFAKKVNEKRIYEIDPSTMTMIETKLYYIVSLNWKISGTKERVMNGNIIEKTGVIESNQSEIERVKIENQIDLSEKLSNKLEFWRGY